MTCGHFSSHPAQQINSRALNFRHFLVCALPGEWQLRAKNLAPNNTTIMAEKTAPIKKLSEKSTKQEMLDAYQTLAKQLEEKRASELAPERRLDEKKTEEAVKVATAVAPEGIDREIGSLKAEMGKMLADISDRLAAESSQVPQCPKSRGEQRTRT